MAETQPIPEAKKSDLGTRAASAVVRVAVAGTALWLGGWWWTVFVAAVALGVLWEWQLLARKLEKSRVSLVIWLIAGTAYVGFSASILAVVVFVLGPIGPLFPICLVVATDIGAYFVGRTVGGPKIAPSISPSKTWSGLAGGILGAALVVGFFGIFAHLPLDCDAGERHCVDPAGLAFLSLIVGTPVAIIAQTGDFFESWMKRRAGAKDSGNLIPGHGGLFDRVDGLLAVCFVGGLIEFFRFLS